MEDNFGKESIKKTETVHTSCVCDENKYNFKSAFIVSMGIILILIGFLIGQQKEIANSKLGLMCDQPQQKTLNNDVKLTQEKTQQEISQFVVKFIEDQLVQPGTEIEINQITKESDLYKIQSTIAGQSVTSYMTKDMTKFIPQLMDVNEKSID